MQKYVADLTIVSNERLNEKNVLIKATQADPFPEMLPGQFVELRVDGSLSTYLRRPISINFVDYERNELWLLIATIGEGTKRLGELQAGDTLNCIFPLGNSFRMPQSSDEHVLLIGGGVGIAPLLYFGKKIKDFGAKVSFLLGARTAADHVEVDLFKQYGEVHLTTEDGSLGEKGFVTNHSILKNPNFSQISTCGPKPMMVAVARFASQAGIYCEVSLENLMACGIGACLCCVEKTTKGNVCVCTEGPVFDIKDLVW